MRLNQNLRHDLAKLASANAARSHGFTLVELLVVIAIMAILVSLLLPAVNAAREAARRIHCANNLKQLGIALLTHESSHKSLPAAGLVASSNSDSAFRPNFDPLSGPQIGWMVLILPFMEEQGLYDQFDLSGNVTVFEQAGDPQAASVSSYTCPTDHSVGRMFHHRPFTADARLAKANYAAYVSPHHVGDLQFFPGALGGFDPGPTNHQGQRLSRLKDGTTSTIAVTELRTRDHEQDPRGLWAVPWGAASVLALHVDNNFAVTGGSLHRQSGIPIYVPDPEFFQWAHTPNKQTRTPDWLYLCPQPAQARQQRMPCRHAARSEWKWVTSSPRSLHPGGVNAVSLDGHVGFLNDSVDVAILSYLISVNDYQHINVVDHVR